MELAASRIGLDMTDQAPCCLLIERPRLRSYCSLSNIVTIARSLFSITGHLTVVMGNYLPPTGSGAIGAGTKASIPPGSDASPSYKVPLSSDVSTSSCTLPVSDVFPSSSVSPGQARPQDLAPLSQVRFQTLRPSQVR